MPAPAQIAEIWVYLSASPLLGLTVTLLAYQGAFWLYRRAGFHPLANPVLLAVAALVLGRDSEAPIGPSVAVTGYYWHFVDVVWVFVFATLYLLQ